MKKEVKIYREKGAVGAIDGVWPNQTKRSKTSPAALFKKMMISYDITLEKGRRESLRR